LAVLKDSVDYFKMLYGAESERILRENRYKGDLSRSVAPRRLPDRLLKGERFSLQSIIKV
jgi:hypothetical protein